MMFNSYLGYPLGYSDDLINDWQRAMHNQGMLSQLSGMRAAQCAQYVPREDAFVQGETVNDNKLSENEKLLLLIEE